MPHIVHPDVDPVLLLRAFFPAAVPISLGLVAGSLLPRNASLAVASALALSAMWHFVRRARRNQALVALHPKRWSVRLDHDLVVFLIGSTNNSANPVNPVWLKMGEAMDAMKAELEAHPELGCLGSEDYVSMRAHGTTTMLVQYWQSAEHLKAFAQNSSNSHHSPWVWLMKHARESADVGFWHETYVVRRGETEAIYINMPPFGLGIARGAVWEQAMGRHTTMDGRLSKGAGDTAKEWPKAADEALYGTASS